MSNEQPYDPYIPANQTGAPTAGASQQQNGNQRTAALQAVSFLLCPSNRASRLRSNMMSHTFERGG